jgi:hypothetical protein
VFFPANLPVPTKIIFHVLAPIDIVTQFREDSDIDEVDALQPCSRASAGTIGARENGRRSDRQRLERIFGAIGHAKDLDKGLEKSCCPSPFTLSTQRRAQASPTAADGAIDNAAVHRWDGRPPLDEPANVAVRARQAGLR